jgi:glycosyltransferase involved in cell wall biosynthesis
MVCSGLRKNGWEVRTIDLSDRTGQRRNASFTIRRAAKVLALVFRAWGALRHTDAVYLTITHSVVGFLRDALIIRCAALFRRPVVAHHHGGAFHIFFASCPRWLQRFVVRTLDKVTRIIVLGDSLRHEFSMLPRAPEQVVVVHNACNVPPLPPRVAPVRVVRVLFLSNLMVEKGYLDVLDASRHIATLLPTHIHAEFHFAGSFMLGGDTFTDTAAMEQDFRRRASTPAPNVSVHWHGPVTGNDKELLLQHSDVFVLPTYYRDEGQPISIIEALTSSLPVVATDYRSIPELLPAAMHVLMVAPCDSATIARRIATLVYDPALYERLSLAAARRGEDFSCSVHVKRVDALLKAVATPRR